MRTIKLIFIIPCLLVVFSACQKDNFAAPNATISGALIDADSTSLPLQLHSNGQGGNVSYLVNDPAKYPAPQVLNALLKADGTFFNSFFFAENYRVFPTAGTGPWIYTGQVAPTVAKPGGVPDSTNVAVVAGANTVTNFKVYPYFRVYLSVVDTNVTVNIKRTSYTTAANTQLTAGGDLIIYVNNYPTVNSGTSGNSPAVGTLTPVNRWNFTLNTTTTGVVWSPTSSSQSYTYGTNVKLPINDIPNTSTPPGVQVFGIRWISTRWPKGTYYWRASIVGVGTQNNPVSYSSVVTAIVH